MRWLRTTLAVAAIVIGGCGASPVKPRCDAGQCVEAAAGSTGTDAPTTAQDATDTPVTPDAGDAPIVPPDAAADVPADMGSGGDAPRVDAPVLDSPGVDTANPDAPRPMDASPEVPVCPAGQNKCNGSTFCLTETGTTCGPSCTRCPAPNNGVPTCTAGACGQECRIDAGLSYACATDCCPAVNEWIQNYTNVTELAMAVDAAGTARIVYANDKRLWYAERGTSGWRYRTIDPQSGPYSGVSMVLDAAGRPHVAYSRGTTDTRYARLDNNAWTITVVDPIGSYYSSIALAGDRPRIVYQTYSDKVLHHAMWDGAAWTREVLTRPNEKARDPSLAVDSTGASHVAFVEDTQGVLWLATRGTSWSFESIGPSGTAGGWPSLALGAGDEPRVAYTDRNGILAYAERNAGVWTVSAPDPMGGGAHNALRLDSKGAPVISYITNPVPVTSTVWYLMLARRGAPGWSLTQLGYVGTYLRTDMGLDAMDRPSVAYTDVRYSTEEKRLRFIGPTPPTSGPPYENVDGMLSAGQELSMKLDAAGSARLAYVSDAPIGREESGVATTFRSLWYAEQVSGGWNIESVDMAGTAAGPALVVDGGGAVSVAYQAAKKLSWAHRQALWSWTFETIDGTDGNGEFASAALDGAGRAFVSYFDRPNGDLKLVTNSSGTWRSSTIDATGVTGVGTSLALDGTGAPRIAYYDQTAKRLRYAFATGTTWTLETADALASTDVGQFPSLALDAAGVAHVAYFDATHSRIRYASRDPSWSAETLDPAWSGWSTSLALGPGGAPRIAAVDDHVNKTAPTGTSAAYTLYLRWTNGIWVVSRVTQSRWAPYPVVLAVDASDRPRIATPGVVLSYVP